MTIIDYSRLYDSMMLGKSKPNYEKSFKAWQKDAVASRQAFLHVAKAYENEKKKILENYSKSKSFELLAEAQEKYLQCRNMVENDLKNKLENVVKSKRETIRKANSAPSDDDIRLLQALTMRSKISESDIAHAAESLGNSLVSLGTLADIANAHEISISVPTADKIEKLMENAVSYASEMIRELHLPDEELSYKAQEFFNFPDVEDGYAVSYFHYLDNSVFCAEQAKKTVTNSFNLIETVKDNYGSTKVKLSGGDPNAVEIKLTGDENISNIAYQFGVKLDDIEKANSGKDIYSLGDGDKLIVPSVRMKMLSGGGFVDSTQCEPIEIAK